MINKNEKIRAFTSPYNIKKWLEQEYTYTEKQTFSAVINLYSEYDFYIEDNEMLTKGPNVNTPNEWKKHYNTFWRNLRRAFKELNWPIEENFLYYNEEYVPITQLSSDCEKIQGIYYLLKKEDNPTEIIEIPNSRIITSDESRFYYGTSDEGTTTTPHYFIDYKLQKELQWEKTLKVLMDGYPETEVKPRASLGYYNWGLTLKNPINLKDKKRKKL